MSDCSSHRTAEWGVHRAILSDLIFSSGLLNWWGYLFRCIIGSDTFFFFFCCKTFQSLSAEFYSNFLVWKSSLSWVCFTCQYSILTCSLLNMAEFSLASAYSSHSCYLNHFPLFPSHFPSFLFSGLKSYAFFLKSLLIIEWFLSSQLTY